MLPDNKHQASYPGLNLSFKLNLNLSAGVHTPASCRLNSSGRPASRTIRTVRQAICTAGSRKTRSSMCEGPATIRARPARANAHRL